MPLSRLHRNCYFFTFHAFICKHENKLLSASSLSYLTTIANGSRSSTLLHCHVFAAMMLGYGLDSLESDKKYFVKLVKTSLQNFS